MIHHLNSLSITEKLYENMQDSGDDFRFAAIEANLAAYIENYAAWHWHEAMEFGCVVEGAVDCRTPRRSLTLRAGEGYFVNSGVLHMNRIAAGSHAGRLRVIQFDAGVLSGLRRIRERFVLPIERNADCECLPLLPTDAGAAALLADLGAVFDAAAREAFGYELEVVRRLLAIWQRLFALAAPDTANAAPVADTAAARIKAMLAYIHSHSDAPLSVARIAAAVSISEREAYRTFRQVLNTTPALYIQQYRVNAAAQQLLETDRPITEIGLDAGFASPNYFNKAFKDQMGVSPRQFRKAHRGVTGPKSV